MLTAIMSRGQYELSSFQFNTFTTSFPKSEKVEECTFMSAYCKYLESPTTSLDQSNTQDAIKQMQLFVNLYPNSKRLNECNELIDKLRYNLESKAYDIAKLYLKIDDYVAAITSFKSLLKDYPDTKFKEEAMFGILQANYKLATNSVTNKKAERYESTIEAYNNLKNNYPNSSKLRESNIIYKSSLKESNKYKNKISEKL